MIIDCCKMTPVQSQYCMFSMIISCHYSCTFGLGGTAHNDTDVPNHGQKCSTPSETGRGRVAGTRWRFQRQPNCYSHCSAGPSVCACPNHTACVIHITWSGRPTSPLGRGLDAGSRVSGVVGFPNSPQHSRFCRGKRNCWWHASISTLQL
jgi:hypothetical protein